MRSRGPNAVYDQLCILLHKSHLREAAAELLTARPICCEGHPALCNHSLQRQHHTQEA